jgi:hypothetical protein
MQIDSGLSLTDKQLNVLHMSLKKKMARLVVDIVYLVIVEWYNMQLCPRRFLHLSKAISCNLWNDKHAVVSKAIAMFLFAEGLGHSQCI